MNVTQKWMFASILLLLASFSVNAVTTLGERPWGLYSGPMSPEGAWNSHHSKWEFDDDINLFTLPPKLENFVSLISRDLNQAISCPDHVYKSSFELMRYSYRLAMASLLLESIERSMSMAIKMGYPKSCKVEWKSLLSKCNSKTQDMSDFINYAGYVLSKTKTNSKKSYKKNIQKSFSKGKEGYPSGRIAENCKDKKSKCKSIEKSLKLSCERDQKVFKDICSEKDQFYGIFNQTEVYGILSNSHIIRNFERYEYGTGCLKRFSIENHVRALKDYHFFSMFPFLVSELKKEKAPYLAGRLFPYGSLQEFSNKGVSTILDQVKISKIIPKKSLKAKVVAKPIKKQSISKQVKVIEKKIEKLKVEPVVKKITAFGRAKEFIDKYKMERSNVDMQEFSMDYTFTSDQLINLRNIAKTFFSRKSLREMHRHDKIGSKKAPIPLMFLKYLIDKQDHQKLFNLQDTVGERFFVKNDIDNKSESIPIELKQNAKFQFSWQLIVLSNL